jgi:hypothetical protein
VHTLAQGLFPAVRLGEVHDHRGVG